MNNFRFDAVRNPAALSIDIWIREGESSFISSVSIAVDDLPEPGALVPGPSVRLGIDAAQRLMDALWDAGVKPSGGEGHTAHIRALNAHLEDMRRLVFERLD